MTTVFNQYQQRRAACQSKLESVQKRISDLEAVFALLVPLAAHGEETNASKEAIASIGGAITRLQVEKTALVIQFEEMTRWERERNAANKEEDFTDVTKR